MEDQNDKPARTPSHIAYQVSEGADGKAFFNRVGSAFAHKDGNGFNVVLGSVPVDGRITLRTAKERLADDGSKKPEKARDQEQER